MRIAGKVGRIFIGTAGVVLFFGVSTATAARLTSPNYQLNTNLDSSFGGEIGSTNYTMTSTGGEAIVGNGASGSYKLTQSIDSSAPSIQVGIASDDVVLGTVTSGTSNQADVGVNVLTTADGYSLSIQQDHDLRTADAATTIPAISASTALPESWNEGTTIGLGYSIAAAPLLDTKWGSGGNFAALPGSATTFYDGTGSNDDLTLRLRLDVSSQQLASSYSNTVTITGTMTP